MGSLGELEQKQYSNENWTASSSSSSSSSSAPSRLPLLSLNHVSFLCKSISNSVRFYVDVLGFFLIKRPSSFDFEGAWLFNYGIGIHLLETEEEMPARKGKINPKDNHISFQCSDMQAVMEKLEKWEIEYVSAVVEEGGIKVDQLFFHDPDGYMVEICNCNNLPVLPLISPSSFPLVKSSTSPPPPPPFYGKGSWERICFGEAAAALMMENFLVDMMTLSI